MRYIFTLALCYQFSMLLGQNCGDNYDCWRNKGVLAYQKGDKETAIAAFKMAKKCPNMPLSNDLQQWLEKAYRGSNATEMVAKNPNVSRGMEAQKVDASQYFYEKGRNEFGNGNYWAAYSFFVNAQNAENHHKVNLWLDKSLKGAEALKHYESGDWKQALFLLEKMESPLKEDFAKEKITEIRSFYQNFQPVIDFCKEHQKDSLSLENRELSIIPSDILALANIKYLNFSHNRLTKYSLKSQKLPYLQNLNLSYNELSGKDEQLFLHKNLTHLDLSHNRITDIPKQMAQLSRLQSLDLSHNHIESLPQELSALKNLTHLYLSSNDLMQFPPIIPQFTQLKSLHLSQNAIHDVPPSIGYLTELEELDLSDNTFLRFIPKQAGYLKKLKYLDLSENVFMFELTSVLGDWENLEHLSLRNCGMNLIPTEIGKLQKLTLLDMEGNHITFLPAEIGNLTALEALDLSNNSLRTLPPEIGKLIHLQELNLSNNPLLHTLPNEIKLLKSLEELDLRGGNFSTSEKNKIRKIVPKECEIIFE